MVATCIGSGMEVLTSKAGGHFGRLPVAFCMAQVAFKECWWMSAPKRVSLRCWCRWAVPASRSGFEA